MTKKKVASFAELAKNVEKNAKKKTSTKVETEVKKKEFETVVNEVEVGEIEPVEEIEVYEDSIIEHLFDMFTNGTLKQLDDFMDGINLLTEDGKERLAEMVSEFVNSTNTIDELSDEELKVIEAIGIKAIKEVEEEVEVVEDKKEESKNQVFTSYQEQLRYKHAEPEDHGKFGNIQFARNGRDPRENIKRG